jgi:hypothetical protein
MLLGEVGRICEERRAMQQCEVPLFYPFLFVNFLSSDFGELLA